MSFSGNTGDAKRDAVQVELSQNIGNPSTLSRSVDVAIAVERSLFERSNNESSEHYTKGAAALVAELKKEGSGPFTQQRLLVGQLRPNQWVEEFVKQAKKKKVKKAKKEPVKKREAKDYYFFKSTPQEEAKKYAPRVLETGVQTSTPQPLQVAPAPVVSAPSAWNEAGTWEERDFTGFTLRRVKERMIEAFADFKNGGLSAEFKDWKVEGDAQLVLVRGKKRLGFEVKVNAALTGTLGEEKVEAKLSIPSVDLSEAEEGDGDFQVTLDLTTPKVGSAAYATIRSGPQKEMRKIITSVFVDFAAELRAEASNC